MDECALNTDSCKSTSQFCTNTMGSYTCGDCAPGYVSNPSGLECVGTVVHFMVFGFAMLLLIGGCLCGGGEDLDECALDMDNCATTEACSNTAGSFTCDACDVGYASGDTGLACTCIASDILLLSNITTE